MSKTHAHHGLWHRMTSPIMQIYHQTVTPFYEWLGRTLFTRATAGKIGRQARLARLLGNALSLSAVITVVVMVGVTTFWSGGAALPLWAVFLIGAGVLINTVGLVINSAASHIKIGQYYDAEHEQHADNNDLRGTEEQLNNKRYLLKATRTLHDINGLAGTVISWTLALSDILLWTSVGAFIIAPQIAALLFVISRASALVSAVGVWGTNHYRLHEYKKTLSIQQNDALKLKMQANESRHTMISSAIDSVFADLKIRKNETVPSWVWFRSYKALDLAMKPDGTVVSEDAVLVLKHELQRLVITEGQFSRRALMFIQSNNPDDEATQLSVLDSMPYLEARLFDKLALSINPSQYEYALSQLASQGAVRAQGLNADEKALVEFHLKTLLYKGGKLNNTDAKAISVNTILEKYPVAGTAHGTNYLPYYHGKKAAQDRIEKAAPSPKNNPGLAPVQRF